MGFILKEVGEIKSKIQLFSDIELLEKKLNYKWLIS